MGEKGNKATAKGAKFAEELVPRLGVLGEVSMKKMFGGYGIFHDGKMFGLVTSKAEFFLKVDDTNSKRFEKAKSPRHGKMPYFRVPKKVLQNDKEFINWVKSAVEVAHD